MKSILNLLIFFITNIILSQVVPLTYNTNVATFSGNWDLCRTWNNPVKIYNTNGDIKVINQNIIVTQNLPNVASKKIILSNNSKIILNGTNKISFIDSYEPLNVTCLNNNYDNVIVDFAESTTAKSLTGFLQGLRGFCADPRPQIEINLISNNEITPLQPKVFRQVQKDKYQKSYDLTKTSTSQGRVHMVLSDDWRWYNNNTSTPVNRTPTKDWCEYVNFLTGWFDWGLIPDINNVSPKPGIIWECWNEPDLPSFWAGDRQDFFETYRVFYQTLKNSSLKLSIPKIAGPSISRFDKVYLTDFFEFCLKKELEVNAITWHELSDDVNISKIKEHVEYVRENFMNNPRYKSLNIQTIEINEIIGDVYMQNPAAAAIYLGYLEQAKVDYAVKACWADGSFDINNNICDSCNSNTLNHLFTLNNKKKSDWWVYKYYGDGVTNRVKSINENGKSVVIASKNVAFPQAPTIPYAQVLFGYSDMSIINSESFGNYNINLKSISSIVPNSSVTTPCYIRIKKIPNYPNYPDAQSENELLEPSIVVNNTIYYKNNLDEININFNAQKECVYQLTISASALQ